MAGGENRRKGLSLAGLHLHHIVPGERQRRAYLLLVGSYTESILYRAVYPGEYLGYHVSLRTAGSGEGNDI